VPIEIRYDPAPVRVRIVRRLHRFGAWVRSADGTGLLVHVPNPGRMAELLRPGAYGWMVGHRRPERRTAGSLMGLWAGKIPVSIDTQLPNRLVARWIAEGDGRRGLGLLAGVWKPEVRYGASRFDLALLGSAGAPPRSLLEVKSANLKVGHVARFPDAPTLRGARHLRELARAARAGIPSTVLFAVQRGDVRAVGPNHARDPEFADAFTAAARAGVRFRAIRLRVRPEAVGVDRELPVLDLPT
jgi:sugar fermentation stimulation protein A